MDPQIQASRKVARAAQGDVNEQRRLKHLPVAQALRNPLLAIQIIAAARAQVQLWRDKHLCSRDYILAWDALLLEPARAAAILEEQSAYAAQMRKNSPFVAAVRHFHTSAHAA